MVSAVILFFLKSGTCKTDKDVSINLPRSSRLFESGNQCRSDFGHSGLPCFASIFGNVLVVYVINKYSWMQIVTNICIYNLALTDISMATRKMPFWVVSLYTGIWNLSKEWCEVSALIQGVMGMASILNMGLIAPNRYMRVLLATPPFYGWGKIHYDEQFSVCTYDWRGGHLSYTIMVIGELIRMIAIAIVYFYYQVFKKVKESTKNLNANGGQNGIGVHTNPQELDTAVIYLMFSSSVVNPILYGVMNPQFKEAFKKTLVCGRIYGGEITNQINRGSVAIMVRRIDMNSNDTALVSQRYKWNRDGGSNKVNAIMQDLLHGFSLTSPLSEVSDIS
ncbi:melatonin receptor type 1A-like [Stylophora pistillata]|uniref:melatonin receptor type 1A-like n=1 Tax=Stylophora pistillata TaxID=50429 RepID=UPI000C045A00|nr:melatonin receptor type 1A-like [Stylophora pistillata]